MSEIVRITVIMENKKQERQEIKMTHDSGMTLMTTLLEKKLISGNFCGQRGTCGRCRVQFIQGAPLPTSMERQVFTPDELRLGWRLACMAKPRYDCTVRIEFVKPREVAILTKIPNMINVSERNDQMSQNKITEKRYLIAVDLGTTTIAMQLMDMDSGHMIDTYCAMNPQRSYGADVLSRIQAADAGQADILRESVWKVLQEGVRKFYRFCHMPKRKASVQEASICCMCIAGNTTMEHLLMGLSTEGLGKSPFQPVELGLQKAAFSVEDGILLSEAEKAAMGLTEQVRSEIFLPVYIAPGISAFVGGDIVAGLYALKMLPACWKEDMKENLKEEVQDFGGIQSSPADSNREDPPRRAVLLIDLGTNGEMAITDGKRIIVTATAAGPAFEGGPGNAAAGSDMIAITASLLREGIIDETGLMAEPYFEEGVTVPVPGAANDTDSVNAFDSADTICLTQKDIRNLQMAKAAVRAGVEILCRKMGYPEISCVYLAGGFGYYLDVDAAVATGLLPARWKSCTKAAGNTSLSGAFHMGKDLYMGKIQEETLTGMLQGIESINLAAQEDFEKLYIQYMNIFSL